MTIDQLLAELEVQLAARRKRKMGDYEVVPVDLIDRFPEINPSNYDHYDACSLNAWGVELVLAAVDAPAVQGEPVAWVTEDKVDLQLIDDRPRRIWWENKRGVGKPIYELPQPAPDVAGLVEALEYAIETLDDCDMNLFHNVIEVGRAALAAHRKGGDT